MSRKHRASTTKNGIETIAIDQVLDSSKPVLLNCTSGFLKVPFPELPVFLFMESLIIPALVQHLQPRSILEIGTASGSTAAMLQANAPGARVVTVDLDPRWQGDYTQTCLRRRTRIGADLGPLKADRVDVVLVDPTQPLENYKALSGAFDLILIDGDHKFQGVTRDTEFAARRFSGRGAILWHDYYPFPSYVDEPEKRGVYPVVQAFAEQTALDVRHLMGTCLAMAAAELPRGKLLDVESLRDTPWDINLRVRQLYGDAFSPSHGDPDHE